MTNLKYQSPYLTATTDQLQTLSQAAAKEEVFEIILP